MILWGWFGGGDVNDKTNNKTFAATAMPDADWWQALWPNPLQVLKDVGFRAGMSAIDLCCGDGRFTTPMSILLDGKVYGVDLDPAMLRIARQAIADVNAPKVTWIEADARDLGHLIAEKVDIVLIANTFHGVPDQTAMAQGAVDVLQPGGAFVVVNWHVLPREDTPVLGQPRGPRFDMRMSPENVWEVVEPSGLVYEKTVELPPYHYGAIFRVV